MCIRDSYDSMFHVYPNPDVNYDVLTSFDKRILDAVIQKFKNFSTKEIVDYMHEETAYTKTITGAVSYTHLNPHSSLSCRYIISNECTKLSDARM